MSSYIVINNKWRQTIFDPIVLQVSYCESEKNFFWPRNKKNWGFWNWWSECVNVEWLLFITFKQPFIINNSSYRVRFQRFYFLLSPAFIVHAMLETSCKSWWRHTHQIGFAVSAFILFFTIKMMIFFSIVQFFSVDYKRAI